MSSSLPPPVAPPPRDTQYYVGDDGLMHENAPYEQQDKIQWTVPQSNNNDKEFRSDGYNPDKNTYFDKEWIDTYQRRMLAMKSSPEYEFLELVAGTHNETPEAYFVSEAIDSLSKRIVAQVAKSNIVDRRLLDAESRAKKMEVQRRAEYEAAAARTAALRTALSEFEATRAVRERAMAPTRYTTTLARHVINSDADGASHVREFLTFYAHAMYPSKHVREPSFLSDVHRAFACATETWPTTADKAKTHNPHDAHYAMSMALLSVAYQTPLASKTSALLDDMLAVYRTFDQSIGEETAGAPREAYAMERMSFATYAAFRVLQRNAVAADAASPLGAIALERPSTAGNATRSRRVFFSDIGDDDYDAYQAVVDAAPPDEDDNAAPAPAPAPPTMYQVSRKLNTVSVNGAAEYRRFVSHVVATLTHTNGDALADYVLYSREQIAAATHEDSSAIEECALFMGLEQQPSETRDLALYDYCVGGVNAGDAPHTARAPRVFGAASQSLAHDFVLRAIALYTLVVNAPRGNATGVDVPNTAPSNAAAFRYMPRAALPALSALDEFVSTFIGCLARDVAAPASYTAAKQRARIASYKLSGLFDLLVAASRLAYTTGVEITDASITYELKRVLLPPSAVAGARISTEGIRAAVAILDGAGNQNLFILLANKIQGKVSEKITAAEQQQRDVRELLDKIDAQVQRAVRDEAARTTPDRVADAQRAIEDYKRALTAAYVPSARWALSSMNTGHVVLDPRYKSAVQQAYTKVMERVPTLRNLTVDDLKTVPGLRELFADLVATYLRKQNDDAPRAITLDRNRRGIIVDRARVLKSMRDFGTVTYVGVDYATELEKRALLHAPSGAVLKAADFNTLYPADDDAAADEKRVRTDNALNVWTHRQLIDRYRTYLNPSV